MQTYFGLPTSEAKYVRSLARPIANFGPEKPSKANSAVCRARLRGEDIKTSGDGWRALVWSLAALASSIPLDVSTVSNLSTHSWVANVNNAIPRKDSLQWQLGQKALQQKLVCKGEIDLTSLGPWTLGLSHTAPDGHSFLSGHAAADVLFSWFVQPLRCWRSDCFAQQSMSGISCSLSQYSSAQTRLTSSHFLLTFCYTSAQ